MGYAHFSDCKSMQECGRIFSYQIDTSDFQGSSVDEIQNDGQKILLDNIKKKR